MDINCEISIRELEEKTTLYNADYTYWDLVRLY